MREPPWFMAPPDCWEPDRVSLQPDEARHAVSALRVAPPDVITVTNGEGWVARCAVSNANRDTLVAEILEVDHHPPTRPAFAVYQATAKASKLDGCVQQLAELGVAEFATFESDRSVVQWDDAKMNRLSERWTGIAQASAKQSRNPWAMEVRSSLTFEALLRAVGEEAIAIVLWEGAQIPFRTTLVDDAARVALVIGPEGGLGEEEAEALADAGGQLASLGPRVLRTEHAAPAAIASASFHYGLLG